MIPKVIHYCWFGGNPIPQKLQKCIDSWKKYCPDYEIIRWDESNYDYKKNKYMKQAYDQKKWGFVPDFARLDIIYNYGGFYLDTDVELIKPLDDLQENVAYAGCETDESINLGLGFGAEKGNVMIKEMLATYDQLCFINDDGSLNLKPSPIYQTQFIKEKGFSGNKSIENLESITIYPKCYFNPTDMNTGKIYITDKTYSIHYFSASWESKESIIRGKIYKFLYRNFGEKVANFIKKMFKRKLFQK